MRSDNYEGYASGNEILDGTNTMRAFAVYALKHLVNAATNEPHIFQREFTPEARPFRPRTECVVADTCEPAPASRCDKVAAAFN